MGYWEDRLAKSQTNLTSKNIKSIEAQLNRYYLQTMNSTIGQMDSTYNHLLSSIEDGRKPTPADLYKLDKYWQMTAQLQKELEVLGNKESRLLLGKFISQYEDIYKSIAIKDDLFFGTIDTDVAKQMINQIWCADGKSWSQRVWGNISELQQTLNDGLIECVVSGKKPTELKKILQEKFGAGYNRADTIVRTEMAHIQTTAAQQRYIDAGITEVEVWADKDERRCDVCGELHQKKFPIHGKMPIPAHPRCRCCIVPVI